MHIHGPNASIVITPATMRMTTPDGKSEDITLQAGEVTWSDAEEHLPENLSDGPVEVVLVEPEHQPILGTLSPTVDDCILASAIIRFDGLLPEVSRPICLFSI